MKLVSSGKQPWELYDLESDRTELTDVAAKQPDRVKTMAAIFEEWQAVWPESSADAPGAW